MHILKKNNQPIILKDDTQIIEEYNYVKELYNNTKNKKLLKKLEQLQLKNEFHHNLITTLDKYIKPMYVLSNLNLTYGKFKDNIAYLLITNKNIYAINIDRKRLNQHANILKMIGFKNKKMVDKIIFDKLFDNYYHEFVINLDETNLDAILESIKKLDMESTNNFSNRKMLNMANNILKYHEEEFIYYDIVYKDYLDENGNYILNDQNQKIIRELKKLSYTQAAKEKKVPYEILNDSIIKKIVLNKPRNINDLSKIKGMNTNKIKKYGKSIINIVNRNN